MSDETKRDVLVEIAKEYRDARMYDTERMEPKELVEQDCQDWIREYDKALPDDLPVIPKAVGEYIRKAKAPAKWGLLDVFWHLGDDISAVGINGLYDWQRWMVHNQLAVARAWVLGVWRVEETGKIVKLEAEK